MPERIQLRRVAGWRLPEGAVVVAGDGVTIRAVVKEALPGVGVRVELFSKTDQYDVWVREDLIVGHEPLNAPAEPEPGAYLIGSALAVRFVEGWTWGDDSYGDWRALWREIGGRGVPVVRLGAAPA